MKKSIISLAMLGILTAYGNKETKTSPEDSSFKAVFTNMQLTECAWKAHDSQQPDEE